jgi:hypothetical protein
MAADAWSPVPPPLPFCLICLALDLVFLAPPRPPARSLAPPPTAFGVSLGASDERRKRFE